MSDFLLIWAHCTMGLLGWSNFRLYALGFLSRTFLILTFLTKPSFPIVMGWCEWTLDDTASMIELADPIVIVSIKMESRNKQVTSSKSGHQIWVIEVQRTKLSYHLLKSFEIMFIYIQLHFKLWYREGPTCFLCRLLSFSSGNSKGS